MISRQKLSSLTIAAIAFLAISVPTFAQTQSSHDESTQAAITVAEPTLALNRERVTVKSLFANEEISPAGIATVATRTNRPTLSMEMFKQSPSALAAAESQRFNAQTAIYDRIDNSKKQFRADDGAGPAPRPRVSFIPSRGQKVPDETIASKSN